MSLFIVLDSELEATAAQPSLPNLADLCRTSDRLDQAVDEMVATLRSEGVTWRVLAEATGMTEAGLMGRQKRLAESWAKAEAQTRAEAGQ